MISAQRVYAMLGNESLWETAQFCHELLADARVQHAVVGGVAVCLHGYQRNTVDLDLLVRESDSEAIQAIFKKSGLEWNSEQHEFRSPSGVPVQFHLAGTRAGSNSAVLLPDPAVAGVLTEKQGLPVVTLARLIETKLACGQGNLRRTHKDFADVVELIVANRLTSSYARYIHKSLRKEYRELVHHAQGGS